MPHTHQGQVFTDIILDVFKLSGLLIAEGDELTSELGLSSARWKVLGALAQADTRMTVPQIAHAMGQSRQNVQRLTDAMAADGLLIFTDNPLHKRAKLVALTGKGKDVFSLLEAKQIPWANNHAAAINTKDLEKTRQVLKQIIEQFEQPLA